MKRVRLTAALALAAVTAACVASPRPVTRVASPPLTVEDQKKDIAIARDRGLIGFEEAARRQYAIQRTNYRLSPGEVRFWEASIVEARKVDQGALTPDQYKQRVQALYSRNVRA
ncbi:hypothetical protein [Mongoliimonas terrestris]|uniref:hypothetical protein n=1 Tax=Mongoliimonas terrestris TaxID=1709001 RepID=UPI000A48CA85|nr:hypothetical protein [Mongoliimonas terrestris]